VERALLPQSPDPPVVAHPVSGRRREEVELTLITPLFGGGVRAREPDPVTPIRGSAIRGHLRFWWRATRGSAYCDVQDLRKHECSIWGMPDVASQVSIRVSQVKLESPVPCATYEWDDRRKRHRSMPRFRCPDYPAYALFPFQGKPPRHRHASAACEEEPAEVIPGGSFLLTLDYPEQFELDVKSSLWAWVNFGGLGSRTRRGCGALYATGLSPGGQTLDAWLAEALDRFQIQVGGGPRDWACLAPTLLVGPRTLAPLRAWSEAVRLMCEFRQGPGVGRNPGPQGRAGRSRWPEAGHIRRLTPSGRISGEQPVFPRAELGLPIVFHFPGEREDVVLLPPDPYERMASPVILKPLALDKEQALPAVIVLNTPPLEGVRVRERQLGREVVRNRELAHGDSPLAGRTKTGSALEAFINFARERRYREVTRR